MRTGIFTAMRRLRGDGTSVFTPFAARWLMPAGSIAAFLVFAVAYIALTPPTYLSRAEILIHPDQLMENAGTGAQAAILDEQIELLRSPRVLAEAVARNGLAQDTEFGASQDGGLVAGVVGLVRLMVQGEMPADTPNDDPGERALQALDDRLVLGRRGDSRIIEISLASRDPDKAAAIVGSLADLHVEAVNARVRERAGTPDERDDARLEELQLAAMASQSRLRAHSAPGARGDRRNLQLAEEELRDLNRQIPLAASEASRARTRRDEVSGLRGQPVEAILRSGALESALLDRLRGLHSAASARVSTLAVSLGPRHPSLISAREDREQVEGEILREVDRLAASHEAAYRAAQENEASLRERAAEIEAARERANEERAELERQVIADTALHRAALAASGEGRRDVTRRGPAAQVITQAVPATRPAWPNEPLIFTAALVIGAAFGLLLMLVARLFSGLRRSPQM